MSSEIERAIDRLMDRCFQYHRTGVQAMAVDQLIDEARNGEGETGWDEIVAARARLLALLAPEPELSEVKITDDGVIALLRQEAKAEGYDWDTAPGSDSLRRTVIENTRKELEKAAATINGYLAAARAARQTGGANG